MAVRAANVGTLEKYTGRSRSSHVPGALFVAPPVELGHPVSIDPGMTTVLTYLPPTFATISGGTRYLVILG